MTEGALKIHIQRSHNEYWIQIIKGAITDSTVIMALALLDLIHDILYSPLSTTRSEFLSAEHSVVTSEHCQIGNSVVTSDHCQNKTKKITNHRIVGQK